MAMQYSKPEVITGTKKTDDGQELTGLNCFLPFKGEQTACVQIVVEGMDRWGRYQNGYAIFAVVQDGKRETIILPARQEKGRETGKII